MTRAEFQSRLDRVFSPGGAFQKFLAQDGDGVAVFDDEQHQQRLYRLEFATGTNRIVKRTFKSLEDLPALKNPPDQPLRGLRIVLDPGHIGGEFARMEERFFKMNHGPAEQEAVQIANARQWVKGSTDREALVQIYDQLFANIEAQMR